MQKEFESRIFRKNLFTKKNSLLLAISGGVDSVVLAHLLKKNDFKFSLAHCNFRLRGKDSEADEKFCRELAMELDVPIHVERFDLKKHALDKGQSTQTAARDLRYEWFRQLLTEQKFDYVLTAHHSGDVTETIFINLLRGTGINGLTGIPEKRGLVVRPMLGFTKEEIMAHAEKEKIKFRQDKSNFKDVYRRNFIRLNVIPQLKKINPEIDAVFAKTVANLAQEARIIKDFLRKKSLEMVVVQPGGIRIDKNKLKHEDYRESILNFLLRPYGYNESQQRDILKNISGSGNAGKLFLSPSHKLVIDRHEIVIEPCAANEFNLEIKTLEDLKRLPIFKLSHERKFSTPAKSELIVNKKKLVFPLVLRNKKTGDKFKPFGMKGFKLLSDFLKDEKLNVFQKEKCRVLVNGNGEIVWVAGYRSDERYKVKAGDKDILKLTLLEQQ